MHGVEILNGDSLLGWEKIFPCWFNEIDRTLGLTQGHDAQYVHAEQGNSHLFAVAATLAGYATLREILGGRDEASRSGRLDLCLISEQFLDVVEAKWHHFDLFSSPPLGEISNRVRSASKDAMNFGNAGELFKSEHKIIRRAGITFLTPHFNPRLAFDGSVIPSLIDAIKNSIRPDIVAWSFPEEAAKLHYWDKCYPGVITIIKRAH